RCQLVGRLRLTITQVAQDLGDFIVWGLRQASSDRTEDATTGFFRGSVFKVRHSGAMSEGRLSPNGGSLRVSCGTTSGVVARSSTLAATLPGTLLLPANSPPAARSAQRWSLQGSARHVMLSGEAYEGLGCGFGFEGQNCFTPSRFSGRIGYQRSAHEGEWLDG